MALIVLAFLFSFTVEQRIRKKGILEEENDAMKDESNVMSGVHYPM